MKTTNGIVDGLSAYRKPITDKYRDNFDNINWDDKKKDGRQEDRK